MAFGTMALEFLIGDDPGTDVTSSVPLETVRIRASRNEVGSANFLIKDAAGYSVSAWDPVVIQDAADGDPILFRGFVVPKSTTRGPFVDIECKCVPTTHLLTKSFITAEYVSMSDLDILADILANAFPDITDWFDFTSFAVGVDADITVSFVNTPVLDAIQQIADIAGADFVLREIPDAEFGVANVIAGNMVLNPDCVDLDYWIEDASTPLTAISGDGAVKGNNDCIEAVFTWNGVPPYYGDNFRVAAGMDEQFWTESTEEGEATARLSFWIKGVSGDYTGTWYAQVRGWPSETSYLYTEFTPTSSWQRIVSDADDWWMWRETLQFEIYGPAHYEESTCTIRIDGAMVEYNTEQAYYDGDETGWDWYGTADESASVKYGKRVGLYYDTEDNLEDESDLDAPFDLSDVPNLSTTFPTEGGLIEWDSDIDAINAVDVIGGMARSSDTDFEYPMDGQATRLDLEQNLYPPDGYSHVRVYINTATDRSPSWSEKTVGVGYEDTLSASIPVLHYQDENRGEHWLEFHSSALPSDLTRAVKVTGQYEYPLRQRVRNTTDSEALGIEMADVYKNENIISQQDAQDYGVGILTRRGTGTKRYEFDVLEPGLLPGHAIQITNAAHGLSAEKFLVNEVTIALLGGGRMKTHAICGKIRRTASGVLNDTYTDAREVKPIASEITDEHTY